MPTNTDLRPFHIAERFHDPAVSHPHQIDATHRAVLVSRAAVRDILRGSLQAFDGAIAHRLKLAMERGELRPQADPSALALAASAIMHSLAVRARAGESRQELETLAQAGVALICPSPRAGNGT